MTMSPRKSMVAMFGFLRWFSTRMLTKSAQMKLVGGVAPSPDCTSEERAAPPLMAVMLKRMGELPLLAKLGFRLQEVMARPPKVANAVAGSSFIGFLRSSLGG